VVRMRVAHYGKVAFPGGIDREVFAKP